MAIEFFDVAQKIALAMKEAYKCDGITTQQNNEPAGDQHAFHFHFHIFPRYKDDGYNQVQPKDKRLAEPEERAGCGTRHILRHPWSSVLFGSGDLFQPALPRSILDNSVNSVGRGLSFFVSRCSETGAQHSYVRSIC
jgi:hypothetical protein